MSDRSAIEWTDATWNPLRARNLATGGIGHFCEHASEACRFCYAERDQPRFANPIRFARQDRALVAPFLDERVLTQPLRWRAPRMIFVCSMTDIFGDWVTDDELDKIFAVMALCPQHTFQVLTKRAARMREYLASAQERIAAEAMHAAPPGKPITDAGLMWAPGSRPSTYFEKWPLPNVWLGVSAEDQPNADARIPELLATPAAVRFVSYEPALGPIDFTSLPFTSGDPRHRQNALTGKPTMYACGTNGQPDFTILVDVQMPRLDLIISGGESGHHARATPRALFRSARNQCAAAGVAYFHKQNGEWIDADEWLAQLLLKGFLVSGNKDIKPPINFEEAACLASNSGFAYEHLSDGATLIRVGKRAAGRLLDGVEHNALPPGVPA